MSARLTELIPRARNILEAAATILRRVRSASNLERRIATSPQNLYSEYNLEKYRAVVKRFKVILTESLLCPFLLRLESDAFRGFFRESREPAHRSDATRSWRLFSCSPKGSACPEMTAIQP